MNHFLDSFDFLELVIIKFCQFDFNFASIFYIVCNLKFLYCLKKLSFPDSFFGFSFTKYFLKISTIDHIFNWRAKCIIGTFYICFSCNGKDSFNCFFFRVWSFNLLHLLIFDFEKASNFINRKDFFWFYTYLSIYKYLFNNIRFFSLFGSLILRRSWSVLILISLLNFNFLIQTMLFFIFSLYLDDCWGLKRLSFILQSFR